MSDYGPDLARIHHRGFGGFATAASPGVIALLRGAGIAAGKVVDLGCGSGELVRELRAAGYDAMGVDASPSMIELARRVAPGAPFVVGAVDEIELPPCDAITALGEVVSYLPPTGDPAPLETLFQRLAAALRPGGILLFDALLAGRGRPMRYRRWSEGEGWTACVEVDEDRAAGRLIRRIVAFLADGDGWRRCEETHRQRLVGREEVDRALRAAGFSVRVLRGYGNARLKPGRRAFRARRLG